MTLYSSIGVLQYHDNYKLIVSVDQGIADYYRKLIPLYIDTNPQKYRAHISVVRKEIPPLLHHWGKYEGEEVEFHYTSTVYFGEVYCWLNVFCKRLEEIRLELGLSISSQYTRPPSDTPWQKIFHCTIGNFKK